MRRFLSVLALGAVTVFGFGAQQAGAAFVGGDLPGGVFKWCSAAGTGCETDEKLSNTTFLGLIYTGDLSDPDVKGGNPDADDIREFKVKVLEVDFVTDLPLDEKIEAPSWTAGSLFTVTPDDDAGDSHLGTIEWIGPDVSLVNFLLKVDNIPNAVFKAETVTSGNEFDYETTQGLSHVEMVATPIPGAVWLFGTGVLGLLGLGYTRRRQAAA